MKYILLSLFLLCSFNLYPQTDNDQMLLGKIKREQLKESPHKDWFEREYNDYEINKNTLDKLKKINTKGLSLTIFMATWCGDTHREVPRFLKIADALGLSPEKIDLICLNSGGKLHKTSPQKEEEGKYIFRVPTIIISKNNTELNRIVEYPVQSLEKDLLNILSGVKYIPNYGSYPYIIEWIQDGTLNDKNISYRGLARQIKPHTNSATELVTAASFLSNKEKKAEAATLCKIAYYLYPESNRYYFYAEMFIENGDYQNALFMTKEFLAKTNDKKEIDKGLELYNKIQAKQQLNNNQ